MHKSCIANLPKMVHVHFWSCVHPMLMFMHQAQLSCTCEVVQCVISMVIARTGLLAVPWVFQAWHICHETPRSVLSHKLLLPTLGRRLFYEDSYTYGTQGDGNEDRSKYYQYFAQNSQNYQNHKSLELGIVVMRVFLCLLFCFFALCCCSDVVQQGCCPFVHSFVVKACYGPASLTVS